MTDEEKAERNRAANRRYYARNKEKIRAKRKAAYYQGYGWGGAPTRKTDKRVNKNATNMRGSSGENKHRNG